MDLFFVLIINQSFKWKFSLSTECVESQDDIYDPLEWDYGNNVDDEPGLNIVHRYLLAIG